MAEHLYIFRKTQTYSSQLRRHEMSALKKFATGGVIQTEQARPDQVVNSAGGFVFQASDIQRLERFLILGTDGGTYYVGEKDLTKQNVDFIRKMIKNNARQVLDIVEAVSVQGRAYRNEAAIFVLALLLAEGPAEIKAQAVEVAPRIARTATHVYQLAAFIEGLGGWGRAKRKAIAKWFESKTADQLAYQAVKYRQRNGWTLRDLMRLSHPTGVDKHVGDFMLGKQNNFAGFQERPLIIEGFQIMQEASSPAQVIDALVHYPNLPWETIPTQFLKDAEVWKVLFANGQLKGQALVRNITRLSRMGAFDDMVFARMVADKLVDSDMIAKTRLHPIQYLLASVTHREGQMNRNGLGYWSNGRTKDWVTNSVIADALDAGFHKAFKAVTPAGKRTMLALDVSGSMSQNALGIDLSCAQVTAAMAMVTARTEPYYQIRGFSTSLVDLGITPNMDFGSVMRKVTMSNFGGTDCAAAINWALKNKVEIDHFSIYTDNETWAGPKHVHTALRDYRQKMGIDARMSVVGIAATEFSIADPKDPGQLDVVGFDTQAPAMLADFGAGRL
jgi:60 kDa SS-A/Ro ribonucleoprotein